MRGQLAVMNEPLRGDVLGAFRRAFSAVLFDLPSPSYAALPRSVENGGREMPAIKVTTEHGNPIVVNTIGL